ncbi:MAG TPA: response regulator [Abditibacteriaceae bacterium]|jgi:diguanylate cyclase (GGDEF)-like protein
MPRNRILIIDDEPDSVRLLRFAFERAGFEVLVCNRAQQALQTALSGEPDAVLLALELGNHSGEAQNGLEVCRQLRTENHTAQLPIMLVTAKLRSESDTVLGFKAGADDYVMKPFRPAEVVARVENLLERTRRQSDLSPLTGLPGNSTVQKQLSRAVAAEKPFGALFIDLDNFKIYNDVYGFDRGEDVLREVARCIAGAAAHLCADAFVGHIGGDDFVVLTTPQNLEPLAHAIIGCIQPVVASWYPPEVAARGAVTVTNRRGGQEEYSLLTASLSGVTNELRHFRNALEVAAVAAETKRAIKDKPGFNYLKDRRSSRLPVL